MAENLLRRRDDGEALVFCGEGQVERRLSWAELHQQVAQAARCARRAWGDRGRDVAEYAGSHHRHAGQRQPGGVVVVLAGFWRGWRAGPLWPVAPKVWLVPDGYYNGKRVAVADKVAAIAAGCRTRRKWW